jgi:hypothetical protein
VGSNDKSHEVKAPVPFAFPLLGHSKAKPRPTAMNLLQLTWDPLENALSCIIHLFKLNTDWNTRTKCSALQMTSQTAFFMRLFR